jgi:hypothetical protein
MSKQREVTAHYNQRGLATSGDAYNRDMRKARLADESTTYQSVPVHRNAEVDAWFDDHCSCTGCCGTHDEYNPENNTCCIIL